MIPDCDQSKYPFKMTGPIRRVFGPVLLHRDTGSKQKGGLFLTAPSEALPQGLTALDLAKSGVSQTIVVSRGALSKITQ